MELRYSVLTLLFFFFKQKTAYEMRISDWSSDVCSSDLPYRAHPLKAAAYRTRRAEALGIEWTQAPIATSSAPRGKAHPCIYRGFCVAGCSTNAKQSVLVTWLPRALGAGAEIRDLIMVGRVEVFIVRELALSLLIRWNVSGVLKDRKSTRLN